MIQILDKESPKLIGTYTNNNYKVSLFSDGTKIRETEDDDFKPEFPETMDVCISTKCSHGCSFCYSNCTPNGKEADFIEIFNSGIFDDIQPYTEIAININSHSHKYLMEFLNEMKERKVIVNATINQIDFERTWQGLQALCEGEYIHGLGISLVSVTDAFVKKVKEFPNAIIHVINGIVSPMQIKELADHDLKLLILGYKQVGRGIDWYSQEGEEIRKRQNWLNNNLPIMAKHFKIISFDNLALEQLSVDKLLSPEEYAERYMGDDGNFSFYLNLVDMTFSKNSLDTNHYKINGQSIKQMFHFIQKKVKEERK